jgi:flagellar hook assembly protein FlgD
MAALDSVDEDPGDADPISVQTHPNPFALSTSITYTLAGTEYASVRLAIYDAAGRRVRTLSRGQVSPGTHRVDWDGKDRLDRTVPSGVYFCLLESRGRTTGRKILVMR